MACGNLSSWVGGQAQALGSEIVKSQLLDCQGIPNTNSLKCSACAVDFAFRFREILKDSWMSHATVLIYFPKPFSPCLFLMGHKTCP